MLAAAALIVACGFLGETGIGISAVLIVIFLVFLWENVTSARRSMRQGQEGEKRRLKTGKKEIGINIAKFVVGAVGIVWGADLLVDNGSALAAMAGIPERVIGVTIIAVGTSLPELITTITAIVKKQSSLSVGNILGANIIDLSLILPFRTGPAHYGDSGPDRSSGLSFGGLYRRDSCHDLPEISKMAGNPDAGSVWRVSVPDLDGAVI